MRNQFQFRAWVFEMVQAGISEDKIFKLVRDEDPDLYEVVTTVQIRDQRTGKPSGTSKSPAQLQEMIKATQDESKNALGPLAVAYQRLHYKELSLRGDLQEALTHLDLANPREVREAVKAAVEVSSREEWNGANNVPPHDINNAIELLEEAGTDVAGFRTRMTELYPVDTSE